MYCGTLKLRFNNKRVMGNSMIMVNKKGINIRDLGMVKGKSTEYRNTITYPNLRTLTNSLLIHYCNSSAFWTFAITFRFFSSSSYRTTPFAYPQVSLIHRRCKFHIHIRHIL